MSKQNISIGKLGEEIAVGFLKDNGYKILRRNFKTRLGEVDIIASDKETLCFIEVKSRNSLRFGLPIDAVSGLKQNQLSKAALVYLKENKFLDRKARFDVVSIEFREDGPKIGLFKNAFELDSKFTY